MSASFEEPHNLWAGIELSDNSFIFLLQILSVDYDYVNDSMLAALGEVGLVRFIIHVHGIEETHPGTSNAAWTNFVHQK
jgi:hypothetical protein